MKKSMVIQILVMIIAAAAGSYLASSLSNEQGKLCTSRGKVANKAMFGFNKFAADIQWMLFINYCGSIDSVTDKNVGEIYKRLDNLLKNDPDFEKAYEIGALMISVRAPEKALQVLKDGCDNPRIRTNWKLPFLAGFVLNHNVPKDKLEAVTSALKMDSEAFFEMAAKRSTPSPEPHVISSLMRAKAEKIFKKKKWNDIDVVNDKQALLCAWLTEAALSYNSKRSMGIEDFNTSIVLSGTKDLNGKILQVAQNAMNLAPDDENVLKTIEYFKTNVLKGSHVCDSCLATYGPGAKFCSTCGAKVEIFGVCKQCSAVANGKFCSTCGADQK